jgi:hypothetical protein
MELKVENGLYIVTIDKAILVLSKDEFLQALRKGKWWKRHQTMGPRTETMQTHADERRAQAPTDRT